MGLTPIFWDMDEVLVRFLDDLCFIYNRYNEPKVEPKDIVEWDLTDKFHGLAKEIFNMPNFFYHLRPYQDMLRTCETLYREGYPTYIITNPSGSPRIAYDKYRWIEKNMPWFPIDNTRMTSEKSEIYVEGAILIDDCPKYLKTWNGTSIIVSKPYNQDVSGWRVKDGDSLYRMIHYLNGRNYY